MWHSRRRASCVARAASRRRGPECRNRRSFVADPQAINHQNLKHDGTVHTCEKLSSSNRLRCAAAESECARGGLARAWRGAAGAVHSARACGRRAVRATRPGGWLHAHCGRWRWDRSALASAVPLGTPRGMAAAACGMCAYPRGEKGDVLWRDGSGSFALVAKRAPVGVVGHMMLVTARHVLNAASFDDVEAAALGPALRTASQAIVEATGAERIYTAALGSPKAPALPCAPRACVRRRQWRRCARHSRRAGARHPVRRVFSGASGQDRP